AETKCALQPKLPERTRRDELPRYRSKVQKFLRAIAELPLSRTFSLHEPQTAEEYDAIVVGSDEVWNFRHPWYGSMPIFFGDGLRTDRLISYAASFGNHSAWDGMNGAWAEKLSRFSALSVRDENSWHLVRDGTSRRAEIVLDPCLQFAEIVPSDERADRGTYALVYGHSFPAWLKHSIRSWARRKRITLISLGYSNDFADAQRITAGPMEFARLMAGASAVVTNFFHGCVFALLNRKPWLSAPSDYRSIKIPDLAASIGADRRIVDEITSEAKLTELLETPARSEVLANIAEAKARSDAFLDAALP
ncbi:MAG TPA: polysaccharide pyruvyl transferase family protein, partial [Sphingomicrobium sp.]|nr:polysaccharide pyruvyl transferase family protein [Sphingomicrobium sp.]